jgi:hypothetical protein
LEESEVQVLNNENKDETAIEPPDHTPHEVVIGEAMGVVLRIVGCIWGTRV